MLAVAAVLSTLHFTGTAVPGNGDYIDVPFAVPAGTVEIQITKTYTTGVNILDFGVWAPEGFRGWSGGLTDDIIVGVAQSSRGYLPGAITASDGWYVEIGKAQLSDSGTDWTIDITFSDTASLPVLPQAPFTPVVMAQGTRWYKGDFHVHSSQSGDSKAPMQSDIDLAHAQGLDFINLSDHNTISQHALVAAQQANWPVLVTRSSEITTYSGHGNGVGITQYVDHRLGRNGRTMANVIDDVVAQGGAFIINHPAENLGTNCIGCDWMHATDIPWNEVSGIEVITAGYPIGVLAFTPQVVRMWDAQEDAGFRLSAVTGSDDHSAGMNEGSTGSPIGSPCTLVHGSELSEAAIVAGVQHQHTIANLRGPDDPAIDIVAHGKNNTTAGIGDDIDDLSALDVHVTSGDGFNLELWRDGAKIEELTIKGDDFTWRYHDKASKDDHRYRVALVLSNDPVVITSHVYAHGVVDDAGGCNAGGGRGSLVALALAFVPLLRARRGARRARRCSNRR
ncbi:MAG TPA: CehA/McbA family metallohydrolase [Kofleriaceae bacterium]|nr:CehA/McbA family metallohydrolase [Kofleriaceae bacterium]